MADFESVHVGDGITRAPVITGPWSGQFLDVAVGMYPTEFPADPLSPAVGLFGDRVIYRLARVTLLDWVDPEVVHILTVFVPLHDMGAAHDWLAGFAAMLQLLHRFPVQGG